MSTIHLRTIPEGPLPAYLTTGEVAKLCGVTGVTVLRWLKQGRLTSFRLPGGHYRIPREGLLQFASDYHIPVAPGQPAPAQLRLESATRGLRR